MRNMKLLILPLAIVAVALALPSLVVAAKPAPANAVTITAAPATITFGHTSAISGQVTGPKNASVKVSLQSRPAPPVVGATFKDTGATAVTDASGHYTFTVRPPANTQYQAVAKTKPPVTSPVATVTVRIAVSLRLSDSTPRHGTLVRFFGVAKPAHDGALVRIQKRTSTGAFRTVATTPLRKSSAGQSTYSRKLRIYHSGTYRVRVPADTDHARGTSARRHLTVH